MEEAINWNIRLRTAEPQAWESFTSWLERDPAHLAAYERVALLDEQIEGLAPAAASEPGRSQASPARSWAIGGAAAAAIAASAAGFLLLTPGATYTVRTEAGQVRSIALEGGSTIELNGATEIVLDRDDPRFARLEAGEALFSVASDPQKPFRVEAGTATIRNLGTVFNVERDPQVLEVGLIEGSVAVTDAGQQVKLSPGEVARVRDGEIRTSRQDPQTIGGWRTGELSFSSASLAEVAADIERSSGIRIRADGSVASRRFSGTIILDKDRDLLRRKLAALLNVEIRLADEEWILAAPDR